jgi:hypothetical protein
MTEEEMKVVEAMETYGGSFVQNLARCFRTADSWNLLRLRIAFHDYWYQYTDWPKNQGVTVISEMTEDEVKRLVKEEQELTELRQKL